MTSFLKPAADTSHTPTAHVAHSSLSSGCSQGIYTADGHWVPIVPDDLTVMDFKLEMPQNIRASNSARNAKQLISMAVLLLMGVACIVTTLGIFAFRAYISTLSIGPYLAGTLNAVAITVLNSLFRSLALGLNEWENHRRASSFTQALVYKMFIFQFINCYFSLFYIAFVKPYRTRGIFGEEQECLGALRVDEAQSREQRCYDELQTQLMMIFITNLLVGTISERLSSKTAAFSEAAADWYARSQSPRKRSLPVARTRASASLARLN